MKVEECKGMGTYLMHSCLRNEIYTVEELLAMDKAALGRKPGFGRKMLYEVELIRSQMEKNAPPKMESACIAYCITNCGHYMEKACRENDCCDKCSFRINYINNLNEVIWEEKSSIS